MNKEFLEAKKSLRKTTRLVTVLVGVLGVLLFTIIALSVWAVIQSRQTPTSFAGCVTYKDAKLLESYPEQCVAKGKSFVNPDQKVVLPEPVQDELSSEGWLVYSPKNGAYSVRLIDGWQFTTYNNGRTEVLTACPAAADCQYQKASPANISTKNSAADTTASLSITYGQPPVLANTFLPAGEIALKNGGTAKTYAYNDGTKTTYVYTVMGARNTVTATFSNENSNTDSLKYIEEMVSTITLE